MKNKSIAITAVLFIISIANYFRISEHNTRSVEFLSILAMGALAGVLLSQIFGNLKKAK